MVKDILKAAEDHMKKSVEVLEQDLKTIRTGRASLRWSSGSRSVLWRADAARAARRFPRRSRKCSPFGLTIPAPERSSARFWPPIWALAEQRWQDHSPAHSALTEERRHELVKVVHKRVEEARVAARNVRARRGSHA
jgi:ribosome recycling factor